MPLGLPHFRGKGLLFAHPLEPLAIANPNFSTVDTDDSLCAQLIKRTG